MAIKVFRKRRGSKLWRGLVLRIILGTQAHRILKNAHGHLVWKKFVLFSFVLIYTKHSLKKSGGRGNVCSPSLVLLLNERSAGN